MKATPEGPSCLPTIEVSTCSLLRFSSNSSPKTSSPTFPINETGIPNLAMATA